MTQARPEAQKPQYSQKEEKEASVEADPAESGVGGPEVCGSRDNASRESLRLDG